MVHLIFHAKETFVIFKPLSWLKDLLKTCRKRSSLELGFPECTSSMSAPSDVVAREPLSTSISKLLFCISASWYPASSAHRAFSFPAAFPFLLTMEELVAEDSTPETILSWRGVVLVSGSSTFRACLLMTPFPECPHGDDLLVPSPCGRKVGITWSCLTFFSDNPLSKLGPATNCAIHIWHYATPPGNKNTHSDVKGNSTAFGNGQLFNGVIELPSRFWEELICKTIYGFD